MITLFQINHHRVRLVGALGILIESAFGPRWYKAMMVELTRIIHERSRIA